MTYTKNEIASMIDHTNLKATATSADIRRLCIEAIKYRFASVCVNPAYVRLASEMLKETQVTVCSVVAFPLGQLTIQEKVNEAMKVLEDGAREIDYVLNVAKAKEHDYDYIQEEMNRMREVARMYNSKVKVIFETCYLSDEEIEKIAKIASEVKPDFIKTSTGFGTGGATAEHVALMTRAAGGDVSVKASGGIRDLATTIEMINAGATRIGASAGVAIIEEIE